MDKEPNHILARKIWMLTAKWQQANPNINLFHQRAKIELTIEIEGLLTGNPTPKTARQIAVMEAQELGVCRVCKRKPRGYENLGVFILNYGDEFAHEKCLENETKNT